MSQGPDGGWMTDQVVAAGQKRRVQDCKDGKRWFHAWISSRLIREAATPRLLRIGSDSLHESIIAFQDNQRLATGALHHGYRNLGHVHASGDPVINRDTSCDFAIQSESPILISYCCGNLSNGSKEMADALNIAFLEDYAVAGGGNPRNLKSVLDIAAKTAQLAAVVTTGAFVFVAPAVHAVTDLIGAAVGNSDGPVAFGIIYIPDPKNMLPVDGNTDQSPCEIARYRCENWTRGSDYEIEVKVKPMNVEDRRMIGVS